MAATLLQGFKYVWNACWRERDQIGRVVQLSVVTAPTFFALLVQGWSKEAWPWWIWLGIIVFGIFLSILVGTLRRNYELESAREPKIKVMEPSFLLQPKGGGPAIRTVRLEIENISEGTIRNCSVRESSFINVLGQGSGLRRHFRLNEETFASMQKHEFRRSFDLRGRGAKEIVEIAQLDERDPNGRVVMLYATTPTAPTLNAIHRSRFPHILTVRVEADNLPIAEERTYRLDVTKGKLEMVEDRGQSAAPTELIDPDSSDSDGTQDETALPPSDTLSLATTVTDMVQIPPDDDGGPIQWKFFEPGTIFGWSRSAGEGVWVDAIQILAHNRSDRPLRNITARIRPDMKDQPIDLGFFIDGQQVETKDVALVRPRDDFIIGRVLPSQTAERTQGIPAHQFVTDYGGLWLEFNYSLGGSASTYSRYFSLADVEAQIDRIEKATRPTPKGPVLK